MLTRPETQSEFAKATPENVAAFLRDITKKAVFIKHVRKSILSLRQFPLISVWFFCL